MPTILRLGALRFFFYSLENAEPPDVHVESGDATAKYWLEPMELARSRGFRASELTRLRGAIIEHRNAFLEAWHAHVGKSA
jgi:hypothetical protein